MWKRRDQVTSSTSLTIDLSPRFSSLTFPTTLSPPFRKRIKEGRTEGSKQGASPHQRTKKKKMKKKPEKISSSLPSALAFHCQPAKDYQISYAAVSFSYFFHRVLGASRAASQPAWIAFPRDAFVVRTHVSESCFFSYGAHLSSQSHGLLPSSCEVYYFHPLRKTPEKEVCGKKERIPSFIHHLFAKRVALQDEDIFRPSPLPSP